MLKEFKEFAMRGNVIDLAVGLIVGAAFGKIVTSFVNDILMPPLGLLLGHVDFTNLFLNLSAKHYDSLAEAKAAGAATLNYGIFINTVLDFVIVAFAVFLQFHGAWHKTRAGRFSGLMDQLIKLAARHVVSVGGEHGAHGLEGELQRLALPHVPGDAWFVSAKCGDLLLDTEASKNIDQARDQRFAHHHFRAAAVVEDHRIHSTSGQQCG